jgi:aminopeptidase N/puromycin-sensitive aminopeptidase
MRFASLARKFSALALVLAAATFCATSVEAERLPQNAIPSNYALTLTPDLKAATFTGKETIELTLVQPTNTITLNALEITFQSVTATVGTKTLKATIALDEKKEQATFTFGDNLPSGPVKLNIEYSGILNDKLRGFYLSKTAKRNYAVTQFESTDARRAYPSFDEPAFKATFDITLIVDNGDTAISNSPIASDTPGPIDGKHTIKFERTVKMSSYLVAFLVGDFQCSTGEADGVAIRSCATPDKLALTKYSVGVAEYVLKYYDNYFGIHYPLKKLDLIGLPDFEAGAMENFGAITFRETALLLDEKTASLGAKEEVDLVIAHEMAHQWFGDLVTMKWWDNIWLNEGFATWMEHKPVMHQHPEWNIDQQMAAELDGTLNLDAQPTTRAIRATADSRAEIEQMFDGISYGKGGAVLHMVENYLGEETFRKGVHNYLKAHEYGNATAEDFWGMQTETSHKPVDLIMSSFVVQPGVPLVTFGEPKNGHVDVEQHRFYSDSSIPTDSKQKWTIPVCFFDGKGGKSCAVVTPETTTIEVPKTGLFFSNAGGSGFYRSAYPADVYNKILAEAETMLSPTERIAFSGDAWVQVRANKSTVGDYLNLVTALKNDPEQQVLSSIVDGAQGIYGRVAATKEEKDALKAWILKTFGPVYAKLPAPTANDSANTIKMRAMLFGILGFYGEDPAVIKEAGELTQKFYANPASVDPTLAQSAIYITVQHGDGNLFDMLQKTYETATVPEMQEGSLRMLAMFNDPVLLKRALDYALTDKVRNQDSLIQFYIAMQREETREFTWKYIQANWDQLQKEVTPEMGGMLVGAFGGFCTADDRDSVENFFKSHAVPSTDRALKHTVEAINSCIEFRSQQEPNLKKWIAEQK